MSPEQQELHDRLVTVAHALITAPFIIVLIVLITVAILYTAYYERNTRR